MSGESFNSNHARRLSVTCRHIDALLAGMENALAASGSKQAFREYLMDLTPAQRQVVEDYIARIRNQLVRILEDQNVERPGPFIPVSRCLHSTLTFINIAAEELHAKYMRGYGDISSTAANDLNRIAAELLDLTTEFDRYVSSEIHGSTRSSVAEPGKPEKDDTTCSNT
jgi:hypothetical protein